MQLFNVLITLAGLSTVISLPTTSPNEDLVIRDQPESTLITKDIEQPIERDITVPMEIVAREITSELIDRETLSSASQPESLEKKEIIPIPFSAPVEKKSIVSSDEESGMLVGRSLKAPETESFKPREIILRDPTNNKPTPSRPLPQLRHYLKQATRAEVVKRARNGHVKRQGQSATMHQFARMQNVDVEVDPNTCQSMNCSTTSECEQVCAQLGSVACQVIVDPENFSTPPTSVQYCSGYTGIDSRQDGIFVFAGTCQQMADNWPAFSDTTAYPCQDQLISA